MLETIATYTQLGDDFVAAVANVSHSLGGLYLSTGRFTEAEARFRQALEIYQPLVGAGHPRLADFSMGVAGAIASQGRLEEAAGLFEAAVEAGVSAYVVDGLKKERVKPILDMAISRFNAFARLTRELEEARSALEDRKLIDQAKGILIRSRGLSEADAYALMRRTAMNQNRKIVEIAQSLVTAAGLLET